MVDNLERADLREILAAECPNDAHGIRSGNGRLIQSSAALRAMAEVERRALASALAQRDEAVAAEREACAKVAERTPIRRMEFAQTVSHGYDIAAAIRARTEGHGGGE